MSQASMPQSNDMINSEDALMPLIDHPSGLSNLAKDIPVPDLCRNMIALVTVATLLKIPIIMTGSVSGGAL